MAWLYQTPAIAFDANFESGNLASADRLNEYEYDLFIQPDINTSTRMWFYFRCQKVPLGKPVIFNIVGINKSNTTFSSQQRVLVRSTSRTKWQRLPDEQQFYTNSVKHRCYSPYPILSFVFQFDQEEEYFFSFGYPYTYSMLTKFLTRIVDHSLPYVQISQIGKTKLERELTLIKIGQPQAGQVYANGSLAPQRHHVLITARCHPGEFPGSYICHGILEFLLSNNPHARFLRQNVIINIVPMQNPDGVFSGYYRTNANGYDLNRQFYETDEQNAPECVYVRRIFDELVGPEREDITGCFDRSALNTVLLQIAQENNIGVDQQFDAELQPAPDDASGSPSRVSSAGHDQSTKPTARQPSVGVLSARPPPRESRPPRQNYQEALAMETSSQPLHPHHLDFVIDLHSHSNQAGGFLFLNPDAHVFAKARRQRTEQVFPQLLGHNCSAFGSLQSSFKESQNLRAGSLRRAFCQFGKQKLADDCPYIYCLEISNSHGPDPREGGKQLLNIENNAESSDQDNLEDTSQLGVNFVVYTPQMYMRIGEKICETLYEIYEKLFK